ncbi:uncharacterized protein C5orf34 homolog [Clavelina lepadiformis]|uniref:uncharacterized protein C5orf34 homolog n=1 Tax=Clavelina lepadiformis TaxID=159417 RepID=UPI004040F79A
MENVPKYINNIVEPNNVQQILLYTDDSVEILFQDLSVLQLSPCGANYHYIRSRVHAPLNNESNNIIQQRCCFATSETKCKVNFALNCRNHFCQRPYVPSQCDGSTVLLHKDIAGYQWPSVEDIKANSLGNVDVLSDGTVVVNANDDYAKLVLSSNKQHVSVEYLVKISQSTSQASTPSNSPREERSVSAVPNLLEDSRQLTFEKHTRRQYVWIKSIFPVGCCPSYWKYPMLLALHMSGDKRGDACADMLSETHAPKSLTSVCKKQFRHKWRAEREDDNEDMILPTTFAVDGKSSSEHKLVKMLWNSGITYWVTHFGCNEEKQSSSEAAYSSMEAWLPDGSIIYSTPSTSYYFTHLKPSVVNDVGAASQSTRMYSANALPIDSELKTIILRCIRFRSYTEQQFSLLSDTLHAHEPCWHGSSILDVMLKNDDLNEDDNNLNPVNDKVPSLFETSVIPSLGKFSAVGGSVQVSFDDGTMLNIAVSEKVVENLCSCPDGLAFVSCRILFTDGSYSICNNILSPDHKASTYTKPAADWLLWLARPKSERIENDFYSDTIFSREKTQMISHELEKINRFNVLASNDSILNKSSELQIAKELCEDPVYMELNFCGHVHTGSNKMTSELPNKSIPTPFTVKNALQTTSKAIDDIDNLIKSLKSGI